MPTRLIFNPLVGSAAVALADLALYDRLGPPRSDLGAIGLIIAFAAVALAAFAVTVRLAHGTFLVHGGLDIFRLLSVSLVAAIAVLSVIVLPMASPEAAAIIAAGVTGSMSALGMACLHFEAQR